MANEDAIDFQATFLSCGVESAPDREAYEEKLSYMKKNTRELFRHGERTSGAALAALWAAWLAFAACTVFTAVMAMMAVFGTRGQEFLLWSHRFTALAFVAISLAVCLVARRLRE